MIRAVLVIIFAALSALARPPVPCSDALIGYWATAEANGTNRAHDASGGVLGAMIVSNPANTVLLGDSFQLGGTNSHLHCETVCTQLPPVTLMIWATKTNSGSQHLFCNIGSANNDGYRIYFTTQSSTADTINVSFQSNVTARTLTAPSNYQINIERSICAVATTNHSWLYINGVLSTNTATPTTILPFAYTNKPALAIGCIAAPDQATKYQQYFKGKIRLALFFRRALTAEEIKSVHLWGTNN